MIVLACDQSHLLRTTSAATCSSGNPLDLQPGCPDKPAVQQVTAKLRSNIVIYPIASAARNMRELRLSMLALWAGAAVVCAQPGEGVP